MAALKVSCSIRAAFLVVMVGLSWPALGHETGAGFLHVRVGEREMAGRCEVPLHELALALGIEEDPEGAEGLARITARWKDALEYVSSRVHLRGPDSSGRITITNTAPAFDTSGAESRALFEFVLEGPRPEVLEIEYRLLFDLKPEHRGLLQLDCDGRTQTAIFNPDRAVQQFDLRQPHRWREFLAFGWEGVWHIWIGFDHILFLLALLLPAVLQRRASNWEAVDGFGDAFLNVVKIVTAFTVAHSITLSLAALEIVRLPSRWVEATIAASVLLAAANNLRPLFRARLWMVAFVFGLIHGFGFAYVLTELGLDRGALAVSLAGFNLGVEAGQIAIVALFFPVAFRLRRTPFYQGPLLRFGSILILLVAAAWLVERIFDLEFFPV